ncbi:helix-turn-helix domain-containing protein [Paenibacillus tyrfis]|uniref:helix-turn-helix domain-containing protein n=1 Tax=Paenibacillus tyrfis TaxID=1501230 RepID=UPI0020A13C72|nr:helix-turn-helix transcriptional regulator [Paenibacillus tyrfis]MCP1312251.1 helix-turn-helix transcriptional regulator [Paenibacillus tyrfis]
MSDLLKLLGGKIRDLRKERGLSQEQLGEIAGFHLTYIGGLERGERNISIQNLERIAQSLDVEIFDLFEYVNELKAFSTKNDLLHSLFLLLVNRNEKEILMAQTLLKEIFNTYDH